MTARPVHRCTGGSRCGGEALGRAGSTRSERWEKGTRRRQMDMGVEGRES